MTQLGSWILDEKGLCELTVQTAPLFSPLAPPGAASIHGVKLHAVHLPVGCVVPGPEEDRAG